VAHDLTAELQRQIAERVPSIWAQWDLFRWQRLESRAARRYRRVVVMSAEDQARIPEGASSLVIPNGVDLDRFQPVPEIPGMRILFVGSFSHFPNIEAFRFFTGQIWPAIRERFLSAAVTAVTGMDHQYYWRQDPGCDLLPNDPRVLLRGWVKDVRPLYAEANLVVAPNPISAGTNIKVLEGIAMQRAIVSTSCGCGGLDLKHGESTWIANDAESFIEGVSFLLEHPCRRADIARRARAVAEMNCDWKKIAQRQRNLYHELL
jgi:glycosyltransferase involved in cell wall biosynthesis